MVIVAKNWPSPSATPSSVPSVPTAPPGPSPEELAQKQRAEAEELRKVAVAKCDAEQWQKCLDALDDARKLDPQGDAARAVQRLNGKAARGRAQHDAEVKEIPRFRVIPDFVKADFLSALARSKGQAIRLECVRDAETSRFCGQLVASLTRAGWVVTRTNVTPDAGVSNGLLVEVATDADDPTQAAADTLVSALEKASFYARGPDDAPPGGDAPLRLLVGPI